jgi:hypothetical protein
VLDYFSRSPFYDTNSINEHCKLEKADFNIKKYSCIGIEFNIDSVNPTKDLYIISKSYRKNSRESFIISYYYIFKGTIYQSPNVYSIITNCIEGVAHNFTNIIAEINKN